MDTDKDKVSERQDSRAFLGTNRTHLAFPFPRLRLLFFQSRVFQVLSVSICVHLWLAFPTKTRHRTPAAAISPTSPARLFPSSWQGLRGYRRKIPKSLAGKPRMAA